MFNWPSRLGFMHCKKKFSFCIFDLLFSHEELFSLLTIYQYVPTSYNHKHILDTYADILSGIDD